MIPEKIMEKIKKCMALANDKGATDNEAAIALKQARALMEEYQVTDIDLELSLIQECSVSSAQKLPQWQWNLIHLCGDVFNCKSYLQMRAGRKSTIQFIGLGGNPELCTYTYDVLLRQLRQARNEFIKTKLNRVRVAKNKTFRADQFCMGWVDSVYALIQDFMQYDVKQNQLVEKYMAEKLQLRRSRSRDVKSASVLSCLSDRAAGVSAGNRAQLHHATTYQQQSLINHDGQ